MSNSSSAKITCGGWFTSALTIAFIVLKLTRYIDWSWWWVLSPLWITLLFAIFMTSVYIAVVLIIEAFD